MSVISGYMGAKAQERSANRAAEAQEKASYISSRDMMKMFNQSRADTQKQRQLFDRYAFPEWQKMFEQGMKPDINIDLENDPIYQATKEESMKALNRRAGATGKYSSSDADNAVTRNMSSLLSDSYNRKLTEDQLGYNRLLDASKIGSGAAMAAGQNSMVTGQQLGQNALYAGNAQAQAQLSKGQAQANAWSSAGDTATNIWLAYMMNK